MWWRAGNNAPKTNAGTHAVAQSFCVPRAEIAEQGYDLSLNRYKEAEHQQMEHQPPQAIMDDLDHLEKEIHDGLIELRGMLE
jgi:type I restriction enzyme M protein